MCTAHYSSEVQRTRITLAGVVQSRLQLERCVAASHSSSKTAARWQVQLPSWGAAQPQLEQQKQVLVALSATLVGAVLSQSEQCS